MKFKDIKDDHFFKMNGMLYIKVNYKIAVGFNKEKTRIYNMPIEMQPEMQVIPVIIRSLSEVNNGS